MKYYSCEFIEGGMNFHYEHIKPCCSVLWGPTFVSHYKGEDINWEIIQEKRNQLRKDYQNNKILESCKMCHSLRYEEWDVNPKVNFIHICHWLHCNCGCTYCSNIEVTKAEVSSLVKKSDYYDLLPILKEMSQSKMIAENADIFFVGGEPTMLEEFDELLDLLMEHNPRDIVILTSAIKYSDSIEKWIKADKANLSISLDSGCAETYLKIKRVPEFDNVINNIKKYMDACKYAGWRFQLKYILIEKVNDNIEEIEKFLLLAKEMRVRRVRLDVEFCHSMKTGKKIPKHYYELYDYMKQRTQELEIQYESYELVNQILERGHY